MMAYGTKKIVQRHGLRLVPNGSIFEQPWFLLNTAFWNVQIIFGDKSNALSRKGLNKKLVSEGSGHLRHSFPEQHPSVLIWWRQHIALCFPESLFLRRKDMPNTYSTLRWSPIKKISSIGSKENKKKFVGISRRRCVKRKYVSPWVKRRGDIEQNPNQCSDTYPHSICLLIPDPCLGMRIRI